MKKNAKKEVIPRAKAKEGDKRIGNCFYMLRAKSGRDKIFSSPEELKNAATEYFIACNNNPIFSVDYRGKDVIQVDLPRQRVYTVKGLCIFLGVNSDYFSDFKDLIKGKTDEQSKEFSRVITWINDVIYTNKFEGAASGMLNPVIISRDLGLKDQVENKIDASDQFLELMKRANNSQ